MTRASILFALASLSLAPSVAFGAPLCDFSSVNGDNQHQRVDIIIRKDGTITWNAQPVTREEFEGYIKDEVAILWGRGPMVYNFIGEENAGPSSVAKAQSLLLEAEKLGAIFPGCPPLRAY
jgi:hypothetical protein